MKNMTVSRKLLVSVTITNVLVMVISVVNYFGMFWLNTATDMLYEDVIISIDYISRVRENFQEQRVFIQDLARVQAVPSEVERITERIRTDQGNMDRYIDGYFERVESLMDRLDSGVLSEENVEKIFSMKDTYYNIFEVEMNALIAGAARGGMDMDRLQAFMDSAEVADMDAAMASGFDIYMEFAKKSNDSTDQLFTTMTSITAVALVLTFGVSGMMLIVLPRLISKPLKHLVKVADAVAEGDMSMEVIYDDRRDEVGQLAAAFTHMKEEIAQQVNVLESLARADLTRKPKMRGENDTLGMALVQLTENLSHIVADVTGASDRVSTESKQVAVQSQELAQGTTEQAASVEQLSSAFFEISLNTKESAGLAAKAADLTQGVKAMAVEGETMMEQLSEAVLESAAASKSISRIIKAIEEISFQTNILAINAAVEAAHAGQHGGGFAVVASEVRSLASKSASSAKETNDLVANMLDKIQMGAEIAGRTSSSFEKIMNGVIESNKLIADIAKSSEEQAIAIEQINTGIGQVAQVIHINSEAAEKCASAAEKLNGQAKMLEDTVGRFTTDESAGRAPVAYEPSVTLQTPPVQEKNITLDMSPALWKDDFGKY